MKVIFIKKAWQSCWVGAVLCLSSQVVAAEGMPDSAGSSSDETSEGPASAGPMVEMPSLLQAPSPNYPEAPTELSVPTLVPLTLTLDAAGQVIDVEVTASAGPAFDEEASRVAYLYRFSPARRDGIATPSRVAVQVRFELPLPPVTEKVGQPTPPLLADGASSEPQVPLETKQPPTAARGAVEAEQQVTVVGEQNSAEKLAQSAEAVTVVDLAQQKQQSTDMGEVLARTPGLLVRRSGGVGSDVRVSLNGLYDKAVRQFVDGVPLWMTALPDNAGALPVNLFERVEVYRGVVPLRLAADALGGAINFVTDKNYETHGAASFQTGSFGTYRGTALAQYRHERSHFVTRLIGYGDSVKNDYKVDVEVQDESGRLSPETVRLFHKAYS
ncbi:MAG TPA: TonB family protein, partial [Polyangiaceae bacterium]|nr:TonB family protein [Polyangiaceae bacterium]